MVRAGHSLTEIAGLTHPQVEALLAGHDGADAVEEARLLAVVRLAVNGKSDEVEAWLDRRNPTPTDPDQQTGSATFI